jgi:hypothetical protein
MARATVNGGKGGRKYSPSLNSKLRRFAGAVPGIVGASIIEGVGGPKAKAAGRVVKTSAKLARAIAREAAGDKAKGMTVRKVPLYKLDKAKVTVKTGSSTTVKKGTSAQRAPMTKAQIAEQNKVVFRKMTAAEKTASKAAAKARKQEPAARREAARPTTRGVKKYTPRASKTVRRARTVDQLGKSTASRVEKKVAAKKEKKVAARISRANRPSVVARNKAVVKRVGEKKQAEKKRQLNETRLLNDKTPVKQYDSMGRLIGSTTKGELRQLKFKVDRAQTNPRLEPFVRGVKPQRTIDDRSPRPQGLTDKEIEILRTVGRRDYSRGEVNPLAQRIVQSEADRRVGVFFKDPRVNAQDKARETAAIRKTMKDAKTSRSIKNMRKNYRGKPMN